MKLVKKKTISEQRSTVIMEITKARPNGVSTFDFRDKHDVMAPSQRITELKHKHNINIETIMRYAVNAQGKIHLCAFYYLRDGPFEHRPEDELQQDLFA